MGIVARKVRLAARERTMSNAHDGSPTGSATNTCRARSASAGRRMYSFISHVGICRSLKPCPQVNLRSRSSGEASNSSQRPCQPYKEARLRWGLASFFTGAPLDARAFVPVCAC
jgi:hypothetical protein